MIEIVFTENSYESLKVAQHYGLGAYPGGAVSVFVRKEDCSGPNDAELEAAQKNTEEKARRDWEHAVPLGGKKSDIYCFDMALSVGQIAKTDFWENRRTALEQLYSIDPKEYAAPILSQKLHALKNNLRFVMERCLTGESVRIWYSHNPDEMCGMYWLMAKLHAVNPQAGVFLVRLPDWNAQDETAVCVSRGWGEIPPGDWGKYAAMQYEVQPAFFSCCHAQWTQLQKENASLRAVINGQLQSVTDDFYDSFILREIEKQSEKFVEAHVIGAVLGKYRLGVGDAWLALRIETMIAEGKLAVEKPAPEGSIIYRQTLRRVG